MDNMSFLSQKKNVETVFKKKKLSHGVNTMLVIYLDFSLADLKNVV